MKTLLLKALGVKGIWIYLVQIIIEMMSAQSEIKEAPIVLHDEDGNKVEPTAGGAKLNRVLDRLFKLMPYFPGWATYWPAIRTAATAAIKANKALYVVLLDAFNAAKNKAGS